MGSSDPRRYSREEMEQILEAASRVESLDGPRPPPETEDYTLAEVEAIAREVGIDTVLAVAGLS